ncbi:TRAP transporter permease [Paracoccus sp. (in: a-proteobacteria)]|uniref:TRAP transporter permease n=1 Tax=Paracoccus sp. TaxID=267 RepID=UPI0026DF14AA|nr:TRAP transporter permease [Paracoccus sp. (in: a-proteobacteria)]MDO5648122.1 TRAP transporter permease [Paracoccus sp. (in: a-proteobacteria)]
MATEKPPQTFDDDVARAAEMAKDANSADAFQPRLILMAVSVIAASMSLFQLYSAGIAPLGLFYQRSIHLAFVMALCFLLFPIGGARPRKLHEWVIDMSLLVAGVASAIYIVVFLDDIIARTGWWNSTDITMGIICILVLLEASRRSVGMSMTVIGMVMIAYALAGPRGALPGLGEWMPGILAHRGADVERLVGLLYLGQEGIFGLPLGVAATFVFMFVLFGAFLEKTGAGKFFIDIAFALTGRKAGGPAKAAVIASAGMGSVSGSAIANVVTTGALTIPLMKRLGYRPSQAGGIEAAASTGGQITPPLMGAGAFLMSQYTNIPYSEIVKVSIFPAILYLGTVYLFVHLAAVKQGMAGLPASELPRIRDVMRTGWQFLAPLVVLMILLFMNISAMRVGFWAIVSVVAVAGLRGLWHLASGPMTGDRIRASLMSGFRIIWESLELGARNAVSVSIACAVAGIIVGVVGLTGLGLKFSSMMISLSGGNLVLALILVLLASLILGLGLPVTASYIVLIVLMGPALQTEFGIPLLIAHLVVFWYSQDSNVTPPVALAAFAGAAIAKADPMKTSFQAWKYAKGLYLIPCFFVFNPEIIMGGPVWYVIFTGLIAILGLVAFAAAIEGWLFGRMDVLSRLACVPLVICLFWPDFRIEVLGTVGLIAVLGLNWWLYRDTARPATG